MRSGGLRVLGSPPGRVEAMLSAVAAMLVVASLRVIEVQPWNPTTRDRVRRLDASSVDGARSTEFFDHRRRH
jgi:hypothetical protein